MTRGQRLAVMVLVAADAAMLIAALALSLALRYKSTFWPHAAHGLTQPTALFAALTLIVLLASFAANRLYDLDMLFSGHREYAAVVKASSYAIALVLIFAFLGNEPVSRGALLLFWLLAMPFVLGCRFAIRRLVFRLRESGRFVSKWLIVGSDAHAAAVARELNWPASAGIRVVGFLDDYRPVGSHVTDGLCVLGDPRTAREVVQQRAVSTLVVVPHATSWESYRDLLELAAEEDGVRIKLAPGIQHLVTYSARMTDSGFLPLVSLQHQQRTYQKFDNDLQAANQAYEKNPAWPSEASRLYTEVAKRFPIDPGVKELKRKLSSFRLKILGIKAGLVLIGILIVAGLVAWGSHKYHAYMLAQIPTLTATATSTATLTPSPTQTATQTLTPLPTLTPTLTPTPISAFTQRDVFARNGCYEKFTAVGKIPAGATVRFLPTERRFDEFSRECVLVEYLAPDGSAIDGWVLTLDVGVEPPPTATSAP